MIDVIFLLLIFSLVTLSTSESNVEAKKRGERADKFDLPKISEAETFEANNVLTTLLFQIEYVNPDDTTGQKRVLVLWPSAGDSVTLEQARLTALEDYNLAQQSGSTPRYAADVPDNYLSLSQRAFERTQACTLIRQSVKTYVEENFFTPSLSNRIEIRAVKETEFRLVNFIMVESGKYDKLIPRCVFRTLTEDM